MALRTLKRFPASRRVAVLGDMRELGTAAEEEHVHMIAEAEYNADVVILMGDEFRKASEIVNSPHVVLHETHSGCAVDLRELAGDGIVVLVKGSRGMEMERVIEALA